jgi:hypothetical protein
MRVELLSAAIATGHPLAGTRGEESLANAIAQAIEAEPSIGDQPIEAECVNAGLKGSCERPRGFSNKK